MRRRTFDLLASIAGLILALVMVVVAILFQQNASFAKDNVRDQLRAQNVFFPPADALSEEEAAIDAVADRAGTQVVDGDDAEVYANDYIGLHLEGIAGGKTYSEASTESRANPDDEELAGQVQTLFRGETLRGLLLTSFAFWTLGEKAQQLAYVFFLGAFVFLVLSVLGFLHYRRTPATAEI
jgi:hypothetical protein